MILRPYLLEFVEVDNKKRPSFTLRTNYTLFSNNMLCAGLFKFMFLSPLPDDFLVLAPDKPIGSSTFLQVAFNTEKKAAVKRSKNPVLDPYYPYTLEAGFGGKRRSVAIYRLKTKDKEAVVQYLIDYWREQKSPDISSWEDVSGEMR